MGKPIILCIDDQKEILAALHKDLEPFHEAFDIVHGESANETDELLEEIHRKKEAIALIICDHIMPGENGIELLARINRDSRFPFVRKILLTGLATQDDTIHAINDAQIDYYLEKPYREEELISAVKISLARYALEAGLDIPQFEACLDEYTLKRAAALKSR